jgi:hypothetical protein
MRRCLLKVSSSNLFTATAQKEHADASRNHSLNTKRIRQNSVKTLKKTNLKFFHKLVAVESMLRPTLDSARRQEMQTDHSQTSLISDSYRRRQL